MTRKIISYKFLYLLIILFSLGFSANAFTEESPPPPLQEKSLSTDNDEAAPAYGGRYDYWQEFFKMLSILGVILLGLVMSSIFLKRLMAQRAAQLNETNEIKILERRPLNQKALVYLLEVAGKKIVVGESPAGLTCLSEFQDNEENNSTNKRDTREISSFEKILEKKIPQDR